MNDRRRALRGRLALPPGHVHPYTTRRTAERESGADASPEPHHDGVLVAWRVLSRASTGAEHTRAVPWQPPHRPAAFGAVPW